MEKYILHNHSPEEIRDRSNKFACDIFVRYIGETFRKNIPELYWCFELVNERSDYYGIPVLCTLEEKGEPLTPAVWVTTLVERCEGNFLRSQAKSSKAA